MKQGTARTRASIEQKETAHVGNMGGRAFDWVHFATAFVNIKPLTGKEFVFAHGQGATLTYSIEMRWIAGVTTAMRIAVYRNTDIEYDATPVDVYAINSVSDPEGNRKRTLLISATKVVAA